MKIKGKMLRSELLKAVHLVSTEGFRLDKHVSKLKGSVRLVLVHMNWS